MPAPRTLRRATLLAAVTWLLVAPALTLGLALLLAWNATAPDPSQITRSRGIHGNSAIYQTSAGPRMSPLPGESPMATLGDVVFTADHVTREPSIAFGRRVLSESWTLTITQISPKAGPPASDLPAWRRILLDALVASGNFGQPPASLCTSTSGGITVRHPLAAFPPALRQVPGDARWVTIIILLASISSILTARLATRGARRLRRGACPSCGYSLIGLASRICPECGAAPATPA